MIASTTKQPRTQTQTPTPLPAKTEQPLTPPSIPDIQTNQQELIRLHIGCILTFGVYLVTMMSLVY